MQCGAGVGRAERGEDVGHRRRPEHHLGAAQPPPAVRVAGGAARDGRGRWWSAYVSEAELHVDRSGAPRAAPFGHQRVAEQLAAPRNDQQVEVADRQRARPAASPSASTARVYVGERAAASPVPLSASDDVVVPGRRSPLRPHAADRQADHAAQNSFGSASDRSCSQPSFSSLMCSMATALVPASRSGSAWNSETQRGG